MFNKNLIKISCSLVISSMLLSACSSSDMIRLSKNDNEADSDREAGSSDTDDGKGSAQESATDSDAALDNSVSVESSDDSTKEAIEEADDNDLIKRAAEAADADIKEAGFSLIYDFDNDGYKEAFVYVGTEVDEEWSECSGSIWYVDEDDCEEVKHEMPLAVISGDVFELYVIEDKAFATFNMSYATSNVTYLYYVEDGTYKESFISGRGYFFEPSYVDGYCVNIDAYDGFFDYEEGKEDEGMHTGHTWKNYYVYYDGETRDFKEYGCTTITDKELEEAVGFDLVKEIEDEGYEVTDIFKRDNGIINVNYFKISDGFDEGSYTAEYHNVTYNVNTGKFFDYWGSGEETWQASDFGGTYVESMFN